MSAIRLTACPACGAGLGESREKGCRVGRCPRCGLAFGDTPSNADSLPHPFEIIPDGVILCGHHRIEVIKRLSKVKKEAGVHDQV